MKINYLKSVEVDRLAWDACIANSVNGIIYAQSAYLDCVCEHWDALVLGNYEVVMPLPYGRKFGFYYVYQPYFLQQAGVFSLKKLSREIVNGFLNAIPSKFSYIRIQLNVKNSFNTEGYISSFRTTYVLNLAESYSDVSRNFNTQIKRNIKIAHNSGIKVTVSDQHSKAIQLFRYEIGDTVAGLPASAYLKLNRLIHFLSSSNQLVHLEARRPDDSITAVAFFIVTRKYAIYLAGASTAEGKKYQGMTAIMNNFIERMAGNIEFLDFEGSMIPGVARFFQSLGGKPVYYPLVELNRLPWYIKWLKKN